MTHSQHSIQNRLFLLIATLIAGLLGVMVVVLSIQPVSANTITVSPGQSIQSAIDSATAGDTILISAGVYTESLTLNKAVSLTGVSSATTIIQAPANSRVISVGANVDSSVVISGLAITGGKADTGAGIYLEGQPKLDHLHIHHNEGAVYDPSKTYILGGAGGIYSINPITLKNSIVEHNIGTGVLASSVEIINSLIANNTCIPPVGELFCHGGGVSGTAYVRILDSEIRENIGGDFTSTGGGVWGSNVYITNSSIISNATGNDLFTFGGGAYGNYLQVSGSLISGNKAAIGGGLAAGKAFITNTQITHNATFTDSPQGLGGGFFLSSGEISHSTISENIGIYGGAGSYYDFDGNQTTDLVINNSIFYGNQAYAGGGIDIGQADHSLVIESSLFKENSAFYHGGAIAVSDPNDLGGGVAIANSIFVNNNLDGPEFELGTETKGGMVIGIEGNKLFEINHSTFVSNLDAPWSAVRLTSTEPSGAVIFLINSIVDGFEIGIEAQNNFNSGAIEANNAFSNSINISGTSSSFAQSFFNVNPQFSNRDAHDFRLQPTSPLIGAAQQHTDTVSSLTEDYAGNPRRMGGSPDIGAFEFAEHQLAVNVINSGLGTVTSADNHINCGLTCTHYYLPNSSVTLTASPISTATFTGWSGACSGMGTCSVTLTQSAEVTATFSEVIEPEPTETFTPTPTTEPTITTTPQPTSTVTPIPSPTATPIATPVQTSTATPIPPPIPEFTITVSLTGTGGGFITGLPGITNCDSTCSITVQAGTVLTLEVFLAPDSIFHGWSAPCNISTICQLTVNENSHLTARFGSRFDPTPLDNFSYLPIILSEDS